MPCYVGLDVGSVSADLVVADASGQVLDWRYVRTFGRPLQVALRELQAIAERHDDLAGLCVTGSGARVIGEVLGVPFINEIVAQSKATARLEPAARTIIEIGGEDSKLILLEETGNGSVRVGDFAMNSICAAGTGSFLDQQASRLDVTIEEFSRLALRSERPPHIAGRCSVFAKTDMIHLQQQGTPDYDIIAGLCFAMARNFNSSMCAGKELRRPIAFQGGVAANAGMRRAFAEVFDLGEGELIIPSYFNCTGALGAVLDVLERGQSCAFPDLAPLEAWAGRLHSEAQRLSPLRDNGYRIDLSCYPLDGEMAKVKAYVGVDVGSISTNVVVLDGEGRVIARRYLMTEGRPIEAVKRGLYEVGCEIGEKVAVKGCASTGSGRHLTGEFVGADLVVNEITTHARGAVHVNPDVDTIFEIGGQDAKYISLENGVVVNFAMNKVCAAGTGSFLEEQAERLGLRIEEEFGGAALSSTAPVQLGERCTVFMESDLNYHQQRGVPTRDLVSGLSYSIVYNYMNRVVEDRRVGDVIFFQGGVAFNRAVKAAFENVIGKQVVVPPHQDILGAVGAALIAMEQFESDSAFRGFDLRDVGYELSTFACTRCANRCEIHKVAIEGQKPLFYGSRCGRFDDDRSRGKGEHLPRLYQEREAALLESYPNDQPDLPLGVTVGIPRALTFFDLYPLWKAFFTEIGCQVVLSEPTSAETISRGKAKVATETCLPIQVAHGHVMDLVEKGADYIFAPSVIGMEHEAEGIVHSYLCPLVQSLPWLLRAAVDFTNCSSELLAPVFDFERGRPAVSAELRRLGRRFKVRSRRTERAIGQAWRALDRFRATISMRGREILESLDDDEPAMVIISRSYNGCDAGINLAIPDKLRDLGVLAIPLDFLPLDLRSIQDEFPHMYWKSGQKIIAAGKYIAGRRNLHAVYISNFRCGPDSFITKFFGRVLGAKPYLALEVDEHTSDIGAITRCEAFLDSIRNARPKAAVKKPRGEDLFFDIRTRSDSMKIYIPHIDDHGRLLAGLFRSKGVDAEALPMSDSESCEIGRAFTTGKECYPCILTTGDIVKKARSDDFDPSRGAFFMAQANGPCRFGQYHKFHRMVLDEIGLERVPLVVLDQTEEFGAHIQMLGHGFYRRCWDLLVVLDYVQKMVREIRPYEVNRGETDRIYQECLERLTTAAEVGGDIYAAAADVRRRLEAVSTDRSEPRPIIGVVGEIYVRSNEFANNFLVRRIEALGGQALLPPFQEWLSYIAHERREWYRRRGQIGALLKEWIAEFVCRRDEHRAARVLAEGIRTMPRESPTSRVLELASAYLQPCVKGEAVLSMGRAVEYFHHGVNGIVNVGPFGCMPSAVVNALLVKFRADHDGIPVLRMAFDGQEQSSENTVLEAFLHQARQHTQGGPALASRRSGGSPVCPLAPVEVARAGSHLQGD